MPVTNSFSPNTQIKSTEVNANFDYITDFVDKVSGHVTLTPNNSKLVKVAVLRQDDVSDSYVNESVILTGWCYIAGDSTNKRRTKNVTFGIGFVAAPVVVIGLLGLKLTTAPTAIG